MAFLSIDKVDEVGANTAPDKRYMNLTKLQEDKEYKVRFIGEGITGFEAWTNQNKPVRFEVLPDELPADIRVDEATGNQTAKFFMTGIVWDYESEMFRVFSITQKTVLEQLHKYMKDEDYGDPNGYDIVISKKGSGKDTKYSLLAKPPKPAPAAVKTGYAELGWDLKMLLQSRNPWDPASGKATSSSSDD
jgi:hypothetical protein